MSQSLPTGNFRWLSTTEVNRFDIFRIENDYKKGYVMEVDLEYPEELHDLHNDLPLAPESLEVNKVPKLIPNLRDKKKYVVHYRNLKQYLQLGSILKKIHRILEFEQSPWMKPYIDLNTEKRKKAQDEFSKDFYKLMNNSVFGKNNGKHPRESRHQASPNKSRIIKAYKQANFKNYYTIFRII